MIYATVSLAVGVAIYAFLVAVQTHARRTSADVWRDFAGISAFCSLALGGLLFWSAMGLGPGASGTSVIENLFNQRVARYFWMPYAGFACIAFTCCASIHFAALWVASRGRSASDA
jgi:hypothetical protein